MIVAGLRLWAGIVAAAWGQTVPEPVEDLRLIVGPADGVVVLEVEVSPVGTVRGVRVVESSGFPEIDQQALQQVAEATFTPARDAADVPVGALARLTIPVYAPREDESDLTIFEDIQEVVVVGTVEEEVSEQVVTLDDIRFLPGSGGDVVRTVQNLPGVARPPFNLGQLLVRGTSPDDSSFFVDGLPIPLVFHFGGLSTVVNGDFLKDVRFLSGGFGVRYGNTLGGVVDLRVSDSLPEKSRAYASVDLFQATGFAEVRTGRVSITASARRSYIDALAQPIINDLVTQPVQAPRFWDGQFRVLYDPVGPERIDAMFLVSSDLFQVFDEVDEDTPSPPGGAEVEEPPPELDLGIGIRFFRGRVRYARQGAGPWRGEITLQAGPDAQTFEVSPDGIAEERTVAASARAEVERVVGVDELPVGLLLGVQGSAASDVWRFDVPTFGRPDDGDALSAIGSVYGQLTGVAGPLEVVAGLRSDTRVTDGPTRVTTLDPRTSLRWEASDRTDVEATLGVYSQFPTLRQVEPLGSELLRPARSHDLSVGVRHKLSSSADVRVTAFHKNLTQLVVGRQDAFEFFTTPPKPGPLDTGDWANDGRGSVNGVEMQVRLRTDRTVGWVAATFLRSTRQNRAGEPIFLFDYDQPVNIVAVGSHQLGRGWRLGGRLRLASGIPYTEIVRSNFENLEGRARVPVFGPTNGARLDPFLALDLRVDKQFTFERWALSLYLDITNVTNRSNQELMTFTVNLEERPITGLPIVPAFGLRADF